MNNGASPLKSFFESSASGLLMAFFAFQLPLSVLGFMFLFDMVWWQAGIAALIMTAVPLVNIFGSLAMSAVGVFYLVSMLF